MSIESLRPYANTNAKPVGPQLTRQAVRQVGPSLVAERLPNNAMEPSARELTLARRGSSLTLCGLRLISMDYLFRFDGAKDNDEFFDAARHESNVIYYAGIEMRVGPWIPDGIRVRLSDRPGEPSEILIALIELEPRTFKRAFLLANTCPNRRTAWSSPSGSTWNAWKRSAERRAIRACRSFGGSPQRLGLPAMAKFRAPDTAATPSTRWKPWR